MEAGIDAVVVGAEAGLRRAAVDCRWVVAAGSAAHTQMTAVGASGVADCAHQTVHAANPASQSSFAAAAVPAAAEGEVAGEGEGAG